ncbi:thiamine phosphate synthase [Massilia sp. RP-1-19]|uniref:Thiamine-phosphate synthase n=1 Tax=Massilia polaris TaxID=2728846 RepID=A0A848HRX1_9BURK|nr:thiamine phosphate synthase [Massilia polaris]NML62491.1 thiamine phosphate synthase [Massilia polaris]
MHQGLYLGTPDWDDTDRLVETTRTALHAGAAMLQYRHKGASAQLRREQAAALLALCRRFNRPLIINDHVELCLTLDADGVHLGGTDASVAQARGVLGAGKIVGASCYGELALARAAQRDGASYVAFGGFYPSRVKQYSFRTEASIVTQAKTEIALPVVVIGGMTPENAAPLVGRGADMVAAISSVYTAAVPGAVVHAFDGLFAERAKSCVNHGATV